MQRVDDIRIKQLNPAAETGDLESVKKIIQANKELRPNSLTIKKAIISGNLELLIYFENTFSITPSHLSPDELNDAIRNITSAEMFKHLLTNYRGLRLGLNTRTTELVARSGNIKNLELLLSARFPQADSVTLFGAVHARSMDCVRFLVEDYKIDGQLVITDYDESISHAEHLHFNEIAAYLKEMKVKLNPGQSESINKSASISSTQTPMPTLVKPHSTEPDTTELYKELFDACKNLRPQDVKRLLDTKLNPNIQDEEGNSPMFYAAAKGDFDSIDHLCAAGANLNLQNRNQETPLIYIYEKYKPEYILQFLLTKGANPYIKTRRGSLFDIAEKEQRIRIVEFRALQEWQMDNPDMAKKFKVEADAGTKTQGPRSIVRAESEIKTQVPYAAAIAKPFLASPLHNAPPSSSKSADGNFSLTYGPMTITFELKSGTSDWRFVVLNTENPAKRKYSLMYYGKFDAKEISQIQKYLAESNIPDLIKYIEGHGDSPRTVAQYLRREIESLDAKNPKPF